MWDETSKMVSNKVEIMSNNVFYRIGFLTLFLALTTLIFSNALLATVGCVVAAEIPPSVYDLEITEYDDSLVQAAGTARAYEVKVKNTGLTELQNVRLGVDRLDPVWFSSGDRIDLEPGERGALSYELDITVGSEGMYAFTIIAYGEHGVKTVTSLKAVALNVTKLSEKRPQTTTTSRPPDDSDNIGEAGQEEDGQEIIGKELFDITEHKTLLYVLVILMAILIILFFVRKLV